MLIPFLLTIIFFWLGALTALFFYWVALFKRNITLFKSLAKALKNQERKLGGALENVSKEVIQVAHLLDTVSVEIRKEVKQQVRKYFGKENPIQ